MPVQANILKYAVLAIVSAVLAAAVACYGRSRGHSFWLCFVLAIGATPLVAWVILALIPERVQPYKPSPDLLLAIAAEKAKMRTESAEPSGKAENE